MRFEGAVSRAIREHATGFYPTMAEFLPYVPPPRSTVTTCSICANTVWPGKVYTECQHPPDCPHCHGTARYMGWKACDHGERDYPDYKERMTSEEIA